MRGRRWGRLALTAAILVAGMTTAAPPARSTRLPNTFLYSDCSQPSPSAVNVPVIDNDSPITIDLFLVLDRGIREARAREVVANAQASYNPLGITLRVAGVKAVALQGRDAEDLIKQTRLLFPDGDRPKGVDAVATLTSVDISVAGQDIVGMADSNGGIRCPATGFLVGEVPTGRKPALGPLRLPGIDGAKVLAHELGHLLGAAHHYGNCVEGTPSGVQRQEASPCTLMSSFGGLDSMNFGTFEGLVVRGYANEWGRP